MRPAARLRPFLALAALLPLHPSLAAAAGPPSRIAVVDLETVLRDSVRGQTLQAKLEAIRQQAVDRGKQIADQADDLRRRLADGRMTLRDDKIAALQKQYEDKLIELKRYRDDREREGTKAQEDGLAAIEKALQPVFRKIQEEESYDLILNNAPGVVIVVGQRVNITRLVIGRLDRLPVAPATP